MVNALVSLGENAANQVLIHDLRDEGNQRRQCAGHFNQHMPERKISCVFIAVPFGFPITAAGTAYVPVAEIVQKTLEGQGRAVGIRIFKVLSNLTDHLIKASQDPLIERIIAGWSGTFWCPHGETRSGWSPNVETGISGEE